MGEPGGLAGLFQGGFVGWFRCAMCGLGLTGSVSQIESGRPGHFTVGLVELSGWVKVGCFGQNTIYSIPHSRLEWVCSQCQPG